MYVVGIIQRFGSSPDHSERGGDVGGPRCVGKFHWITVDRVGDEIRINTSDTPFDVELTDEPGLHDELTYDMNFDPYSLLDPRGNQYFR